VRLPNKNDS
jgi:hypothetical protein